MKTALTEHKYSYSVISEKQRVSQKLMRSRAGPAARDGATQERRGSDREAVLLCPLSLPAFSPFPTLGSQTSNPRAKFSYGCVIFGPGLILLGILHQIPGVQIILD